MSEPSEAFYLLLETGFKINLEGPSGAYLLELTPTLWVEQPAATGLWTEQAAAQATWIEQ